MFRPRTGGVAVKRVSVSDAPPSVHSLHDTTKTSSSGSKPASNVQSATDSASVDEHGNSTLGRGASSDDMNSHSSNDNDIKAGLTPDSKHKDETDYRQDFYAQEDPPESTEWAHKVGGNGSGKISPSSSITASGAASVTASGAAGRRSDGIATRSSHNKAVDAPHNMFTQRKSAQNAKYVSQSFNPRRQWSPKKDEKRGHLGMQSAGDKMANGGTPSSQVAAALSTYGVSTGGVKNPNELIESLRLRSHQYVAKHLEELDKKKGKSSNVNLFGNPQEMIMKNKHESHKDHARYSSANELIDQKQRERQSWGREEERHRTGNAQESIMQQRLAKEGYDPRHHDVLRYGETGEWRNDADSPSKNPQERMVGEIVRNGSGQYDLREDIMASRKSIQQLKEQPKNSQEMMLHNQLQSDGKFSHSAQDENRENNRKSLREARNAREELSLKHLMQKRDSLASGASFTPMSMSSSIAGQRSRRSNAGLECISSKNPQEIMRERELKMEADRKKPFENADLKNKLGAGYVDDYYGRILENSNPTDRAVGGRKIVGGDGTGRSSINYGAWGEFDPKASGSMPAAGVFPSANNMGRYKRASLHPDLSPEKQFHEGTYSTPFADFDEVQSRGDMEGRRSLSGNAWSESRTTAHESHSIHRVASQFFKDNARHRGHATSPHARRNLASVHFNDVNKNVGETSPRIGHSTSISAAAKGQERHKTMKEDGHAGKASGVGDGSPSKWGKWKPPSKEQTNQDSEPAGAHNIFTIVRPEPRSRVECACLGCPNFIDIPNPKIFNQFESHLQHMQVSAKNGRVVAKECYKPNEDEPYRIRKSHPNLQFENIKPAALFYKEPKAFFLGNQSCSTWSLYRDDFLGNIAICSKQCVHKLFTLAEREKPILRDAGWSLCRLIKSGDEKAASEHLKQCTEVQDVNFRDPTLEDCPILHLSIRNNFSCGFIKRLLEAKAEVDAKTKSGWTAVHYASLNENEDRRVIPFGTKRETRSYFLDLLWEKKCNIDATTMHGRSPLILAAMNGNYNACLWLIEHGCNRYAREHSAHSGTYYTARDWAWRSGYNLIVTLLDDVEKAEGRKDWAPGQPFIGRGKNMEED